MTPTIADRLFDADEAKADLELRLENAGVKKFDDFTWDYYDGSLELHLADNDMRLSLAQQQVCIDAGFLKVYVNHINKWETHYAFGPQREPVKGWRVSYPHKRCDDDPAILLEKKTKSWPEEWYTNGKVRVVS